MNRESTVFAQLMDFVPYYQFQKCVDRHQGNKWVQSFTCWEQFLVLCFAQLTFKESLRAIEVSLEAMRHKLYHMGFRNPVRRNTLANANKKRDYRIYRDFANKLIEIALSLYAEEMHSLNFPAAVYALDSTIIDLCLSLFPWAPFRQTKAAIKLHTLLDINTSIPVFLVVTKGLFHDVNVLDYIALPAGSFLIIDRAYLHFKRLYRLTQQAVFFVIRSRRNLGYHIVKSNPVDKSTGVICDHLITLKSFYPEKGYPQCLRRIRYFDKETGKRLVFLTNNFMIPAKNIAELYRERWQIEVFFKWIKQHLRIKSFFGTTENAVKTQIWIAVSVYVLLVKIKKELDLPQDLHTIMEILHNSLFEKIPILQVFTKSDSTINKLTDGNQLFLL